MWHHTTIVLPRERLLFCDLVTPVPRAAGLGPPCCARKESEEPVSSASQPGGSGLSLCSAGEQRKGILAALHDPSLTAKGMPMQEWLRPGEYQEASKELTSYRSIVAAQCPLAGAAC